MSRLTSTLLIIIGVAVLAATGAVVDVDGDSLNTLEELDNNTNPLNSDTDNDGLNDNTELNTHNTDPNNPDSDSDKLLDGAEINTYNTDPLAADTDNDKLNDGREIELGTDPRDKDTDGDTLTDHAEVTTHNTNPTSADTDNDGLDDNAELNTHNTNPNNPDSDSDDLADGREITLNTDPNNADTDGDTLSDGAEVNTHNTDPLSTDTDNDQLDDARELELDTNPRSKDTDGDTLSDYRETTSLETDPTNADTDRDGLRDDAEYNHETDPVNADTDSDGLKDGVEVHGTNFYEAADPLRKDIFVEIDYMPGMGLSQTDINGLINAYDSAPVENPNGEDGIHLHLYQSKTSIAYESTTSATSYYRSGGGLDQHFDTNGYGFWHVMIVDDVTSSSQQNLLGVHQRGSPGMLVESQEQGHTGSTTMHELGHALGLTPTTFRGIDSTTVSGDDYPSVMNYNAVPVCEPGWFGIETCSTRNPFYDYSTGNNSLNDHNDWAYIEQFMNTPPTDAADNQYTPNQ